MKRYHIAIEGLPTETVLAENGSDVFRKTGFESCEHDREYVVKVYVAMDGEPDYPIVGSEFFPDRERRPVVVAMLSMSDDAPCGHGDALESHDTNAMDGHADSVACASCDKTHFLRSVDMR